MFFNRFINSNKDSNYDKYVILFNDGVDSLKKGDFENALDIFLKLKKYDFEINEVLIGMCLSYKGLNKYEESLDCINNALRFNSSFRELNIKGEILVRLGHYEEALKVLDKAISTNDKKVNHAKLTKVKTLKELGRVDEALDLLNNINFNDDEQHDATLWNIKGNNYFYLDQYEKSVDCYFNALNLGYDKYGSYFNIGNAFAQLKDYEGSLLYFNKALTLNKEDAELWYNRSLSLYHIGRYDEALLSIDKALDLNYDNLYLYNKAGFLFELGDLKDSLNIYKNLVEESPNDISLLINISMVMCGLECYEDSLEYSDMVLSLDSQNEDALFYKFKSLKGLKQYDDAMVCIENLIILNPLDEVYSKEKNELIKLVGK